MVSPFIPLQAGLAIGSAGLGIAQTIAANRAGKRAREENERQLEELLRRREAGQLGLTGAERRSAEQQLLTPVQITAAEQQQRIQAQTAAGGSRSAGDIARARRRIEGTQALGAQAAASNILQQDIQARRLQEQEIEARLDAEKSLKLEKINRTFGAISQGAEALGGLAGSPPGTFGAAGAFGGGARAVDTGALATNLEGLGVTGDRAEALISLEERFPGILDDLLGQQLRPPGV